jgi:hypothetical protein
MLGVFYILVPLVLQNRNSLRELFSSHRQIDLIITYRCRDQDIIRIDVGGTAVLGGTFDLRLNLFLVYCTVETC